MFSGSMVAIVTPFDSQGKFAEETYRQLIDFQKTTLWSPGP